MVVWLVVSSYQTMIYQLTGFIKFYWYKATPIGLHIIYGCFPSTIAYAGLLLIDGSA